MNTQQPTPKKSPSRRAVLGIAGAAMAAPYVWIPSARAATQVLVRTPGGAYDAIRREVIYEPFTAATGIQVVPVAATTAKLMAMFRSGRVELDVIDTGDNSLIELDRAGALAPIPYGEFKFTHPDDIDAAYRKKAYVGNFIYASVLAYNNASFSKANAPKSWADFWDAKQFPGPRMLADIAAGAPNLEFALLADGVPRDKLYPLDIERAFASLSRIRPAIKKFWDTGALSAQMLADKEVLMGSVWHTRVQNVIDKGAPLAIEWNQHMVQLQAYGIFKGAQNMDAAKKFVDFCLSTDAQSKFAPRWNCGTVTKSAYAKLSTDFKARVPGGTMTEAKGFVMDSEWWADNQAKVSTRWSSWILGK